MKILIGGSHGLVGTALIKSLEAEGHEIFRLVRRAPDSKTEIEWSPDRYSIALARIEGFDAVVNLAGESIAEGRWTDEKKRKDSREPREGHEIARRCAGKPDRASEDLHLRVGDWLLRKSWR